MSSENKALLRRWFDKVWTQGQVSAIDELLAANGVAHGLGDDLHGPEGFKPFHAAYRDAFPDVRIHIDDVIAEGDMVAARWTATATHQGNALGFAATGRPATFQGMTFARVREGKILEGWNSFDQLGMLRQLGVVDQPS